MQSPAPEGSGGVGAFLGILAAGSLGIIAVTPRGDPSPSASGSSTGSSSGGGAGSSNGKTDSSGAPAGEAQAPGLHALCSQSCSLCGMLVSRGCVVWWVCQQLLAPGPGPGVKLWTQASGARTPGLHALHSRSRMVSADTVTMSRQHRHDLASAAIETPLGTGPALR